MLAPIAAALLTFAALVSAEGTDHDFDFAQWRHRSDDSDLFKYITRPDLRPPRLNIALNKKELTAPGYLFVTPYDCLGCSNVPATSYITRQIGPHIYTQDGELVWSGTELFQGTKVFDFKPVMINGEYHLSLVAPTDAQWQPFPDGFATVLNASYQPTFSITSKELSHTIDMHEFHILDDGQTALIGMVNNRKLRESEKLPWEGIVRDCTFAELDLRTRKQSFQWTASDHVPLSESANPPPTAETSRGAWDWFGLNSMDKDMFGNYLISARETNTIYYVSPEGSIIWRLGGLNSSFQQNFNFSRQHHARVRDQNQVNMVISFFDNAADDTDRNKPTSNSSSLLVVGLNLETMVADLYHRHERPDGGLTKTNGNIQFLPNGGVFGGWGENAYMTEYINRGGEKLYEASFISKRFTNYRAYKMEFVAQPVEKPTIKGFISTNSQSQLKTAIYVSWNGATEVATWKFYSHSSKNGVAKDIEIGRVPKTGFETSFIAMGYHPITFAEALDSFGNSLANSSLDVTEIPPGFHNTANPMYGRTERRPVADFLSRTAVAFIAGLAVATFWARYRTGKNNISWKPGSLRWASKRKR